CAWTTGQFGISDVYLGVLARLGAGGVVEIVEPDLTADERAALAAAAGAAVLLPGSTAGDSMSGRTGCRRGGTPCAICC
nr:hypothetical protein [Acidimicrobiia bacterium]